MIPTSFFVVRKSDYLPNRFEYQSLNRMAAMMIGTERPT
ncbi:hypothetical protein NMA510612_0876 [Neisseria meningitidis]|uniref:Uncharacterized protein n=1 Tax=Neisseria meningitidis TaxID=487 RepID=X5F7P3_NEIME|nr:hypothetical protein NMA510612_0876 [Neisseria meningitidis]